MNCHVVLCLVTMHLVILCLHSCVASLKHRSVMHYGYRFDYTANAVDRTPLPRNIPTKFLNLMERLLQQNLISQLPDQLTVNQYQPGQGKKKLLQIKLFFVCCGSVLFTRVYLYFQSIW